MHTPKVLKKYVHFHDMDDQTYKECPKEARLFVIINTPFKLD